MATVVGTLQVDLVTNTASFTFDDAVLKGKKAGKDIQDSFDKIDMREARGGIMVLGEEIGIHLPRHVQAFVATLPGVGAAMSAAFPILAIVAAGKALADFIAKEEKHSEELAKARAEIMDNVDALGKHAGAIEIANLKLKDQIAIIEKKPAMNGPKILLEEDKDAARELLNAYDKVIAKIDEFAQKTQQGLVMSLLNGNDGSRELAGMVSAHEAAVARIKADRLTADVEGNKAAVKASDAALEAENVTFDKYVRHRLQAIQDEISARTKPHTVTAHDDDGNQLPDVIVQEQLADATKLVNAAHAAELAILVPLIEAKKNYNRESKDQGANTRLKAEKDLAEAQEVADNFVQKSLHTKNKILTTQQRLNKEANEDMTAQQALAKWAEIQYNAAQKQEALDNLHAANTNRIQELQSSISNSQAEHTARMQVEQGYLTEQKADQIAIAKLRANQVNDLRDSNSLLDQQKAKLDLLAKDTFFGMVGSDAMKAEYQKAFTEYQNFKLKQLALTKTTNAQIQALELKLADTEGAQWRKMFQDFGQVQKNMGVVYRQTIQSMNSGLAEFITTGQANWRQMAASAIESIIQVGLQYIETKIAMMIIDKLSGGDAEDKNKKQITSNAQLAQSDAYTAADNTLAQAPWPANMIAAPAVLAVGLSFAALAGKSASQGGLLGNEEALVHTHPEEMILPKHISNFIVNAVGAASGGSNSKPSSRGDIHVHLHDVTDGAGVEGMVKKKILPLIRREVGRGRF